MRTIMQGHKVTLLNNMLRPTFLDIAPKAAYLQEASLCTALGHHSYCELQTRHALKHSLKLKMNGALELCCQVALFNKLHLNWLFFPLSNTYQEAHCSNI